MLSAKRSLLLAAACILQLASFVPSATGATPTTFPALDEQVVDLIRQAATEEDNCVWRYSAMTARFNPMDVTAAYAARPVNCAAERVVYLGTDAINPLLRIVGDPRLERKLGTQAALALRPFDDPRIPAEFARLFQAGQLDRFGFGAYAMQWFWAHINIDDSMNMTDKQVGTWVHEFAVGRRFERVLDFLDKDLKDDNLYPHDLTLARWFNRWDDVDIDDMLQQTPIALAWRNEQLQRGFDPVVAFLPTLHVLAHDQMLDAALKSTFADPKDQEACRQLYTAVYDGSVDRAITPHVPFQTWYRDHRARLVYDERKHRFIVGTP